MGQRPCTQESSSDEASESGDSVGSVVSVHSDDSRHSAASGCLAGDRGNASWDICLKRFIFWRHGDVGHHEFARSETLKMRPTPSKKLHMKKALLVDNKDKKIADYFEVDMKRVLGEGGYASVCMGKDKKSSQEVERAVKIIKKDMIASRSRLQQEIEILMLMDHPNINKLFQVFEDRRYIYLVLELCTGGELFDRIHELGHLTEREAAIIMQQILQAVSYMHKNGVAHRDLKPENFLFVNKAPIEGNVLKVIDFGIAATFKPGTEPFTERTGTPYYVAPEVLPGASEPTYGPLCDVWSCGVVMYVLLSGRLPFRGASDAETFAKVRRGKFAFPPEAFGDVSEDAKRLIRRMLTVNVRRRCTAEEALNNEWTRDFAPLAAPAPLLNSVVQSIRCFQMANKLKRVALHVVARQMDEGQIKALKNIFMDLDRDGNGHLTVAELAEGLRRAQLTHELPQELETLVAGLDTDGSGEIDYTEFLAATLERRQYINEHVCRAAFRVFDKNDDGRISRQELAEVLGQRDVVQALGREAVDSLMREVDHNDDGFIDFEEFMKNMNK